MIGDNVQFSFTDNIKQLWGSIFDTPEEKKLKQVDTQIAQTKAITQVANKIISEVFPSASANTKTDNLPIPPKPTTSFFDSAAKFVKENCNCNNID